MQVWVSGSMKKFSSGNMCSIQERFGKLVFGVRPGITYAAVKGSHGGVNRHGGITVIKLALRKIVLAPWLIKYTSPGSGYLRRVLRPGGPGTVVSRTS